MKWSNCLSCETKIYPKGKHCRVCYDEIRRDNKEKRKKPRQRIRRIVPNIKFNITKAGRLIIRCPECNLKWTVYDSPYMRCRGSKRLCVSCIKKGSRNKSWRGGKKLLTCRVCNKKVTVSPRELRIFYKARTEDGYYLCGNCRERSGASNPNWKGGGSFEPYPIGWNEKLRNKIRKRDNFTCQRCGKKQGKRKLHVHHIDYCKENLNEENLIALCLRCHVKTNGNRKFWIGFFLKEKVA